MHTVLYSTVLLASLSHSPPIMAYSKTISNVISARTILETDELAPPLKDSVRACRPHRRHRLPLSPTNVPGPAAPRTRNNTGSE
ncbi:hypothetical protein F5888DRAFT_1738963 [Russula emetica]|nr:hypothetical protein F5888DRAFT_1738963 [Russula emetica]